MKINPNLSGTGNLFLLINAANPGRNFLPSQVVIKSVSERLPDQYPYNASAVLEGAAEGPYKNTQTVYYNRRPITEAVTNPKTTYLVTGETTVEDLLVDVCAALKIIRTDVELVDLRTEVDAATSTMTLRPIANAKLYVNRLDIILFWTGTDIAEEISVLGVGDKLDELINKIMPSHGYI